MTDTRCVMPGLAGQTLEKIKDKTGPGIGGRFSALRGPRRAPGGPATDPAGRIKNHHQRPNPGPDGGQILICGCRPKRQSTKHILGPQGQPSFCLGAHLGQTGRTPLPARPTSPSSFAGLQLPALMGTQSRMGHSHPCATVIHVPRRLG